MESFNVRPAQVEIVARFLEDFAFETERESKLVPMIPKEEKSYIGFSYDAERLLRLLDTEIPLRENNLTHKHT